MKFSYNWLQSFFREKLPHPEKLAELLTRHSFEVESVAKKSKDFILDIDVLPNRAHDCVSHIGIAREIAVIANKKLKTFEIEKLRTIENKISPVNFKIKCPKLVPRYSAIVIEGVKVKQSPQWLKQRLEAVGIRSINNIVDLTNYVMLEIGQPLHAFDYDKIKSMKIPNFKSQIPSKSKISNSKSKTIIIRKAKKGEKVITLDALEHNLDKGMLVMENELRLVDLVGIMGGKLSEIDSKTKNIILQAGNFDRKNIYQTAKKLAHSTDASNIYSQSIDPNLTIFSLERAYFLLKKFTKGKIVQIIDIYPKKVFPKKIKLDLDYVEKLLGIKISNLEIKNILQKLDLKIENCPVDSEFARRRSQARKLKILDVVVPTFRLDISIPEDLIEEIGRIYGYQKIPATFPTVSLIPPKRNLEIFWQDMTKNILKEAGFIEVYNYSFVGEEIIEIFKWRNKEIIEIENPISIEQKYLRPSLIPNLLKNIKQNLRYYKELKIFELGKTFLKPLKQSLRDVNGQAKIEKRTLTGIITGESFYQLKGVVDLLLNKLGISDIWYDEFQPIPEESKLNLWHFQRRAEIKIARQEIGFLGEIHPHILEKLKIKERVAAFDIDFEKLQKLASEEHQYQPISPYPAVIRDLAILVPLKTKVVDVLNIINLFGGKLVREVELFDIYQGKEIKGLKKNLAFHIIYQAEDKTLSSKEIDELHWKIIKALEKNAGWKVRK